MIYFCGEGRNFTPPGVVFGLPPALIQTDPARHLTSAGYSAALSPKMKKHELEIWWAGEHQFLASKSDGYPKTLILEKQKSKTKTHSHFVTLGRRYKNTLRTNITSRSCLQVIYSYFYNSAMQLY
jgi:hypothetical protein